MKVKNLDELGLVNLVPLSRALDMNGALLPRSERLREEIHLITPDKKVYRGVEAVGILAGLFPRSKVIGSFILLPGIKPVARFVYGLIARHRMRLSRLVALN